METIGNTSRARPRDVGWGRGSSHATKERDGGIGTRTKEHRIQTMQADLLFMYQQRRESWWPPRIAPHRRGSPLKEDNAAGKRSPYLKEMGADSWGNAEGLLLLF